MLDLECEGAGALVVKLFQVLLDAVNPMNASLVEEDATKVLWTMLEESEDVGPEILSAIMERLVQPCKTDNSAAHALACELIRKNDSNLQLAVQHFLIDALKNKGNGEHAMSKRFVDVLEAIAVVDSTSLVTVWPVLMDELHCDDEDARMRAVKVFGRVLAAPGSTVAKDFAHYLTQFLRRFQDKKPEVRVEMLKWASAFVLNSECDDAAIENVVVSHFKERLYDFEEKVRVAAVAAVSDIAEVKPNAIDGEMLRSLGERMRDKRASVRHPVMKRLGAVYRAFAGRHADAETPAAEAARFDWIPSTLLKGCAQADVMHHGVEPVIVDLFPARVSVERRSMFWLSALCKQDEHASKALCCILRNKTYAQRDVRAYLDLRTKSRASQMSQGTGEELADVSADDFTRAIHAIACHFPDQTKAVASMEKVHAMKDGNIFRGFSSLLKPELSAAECTSITDDVLKRIGSKSATYEFAKLLMIKIAQQPFGREHVRKVLDIVAAAAKHKNATGSMTAALEHLVQLAGSAPHIFQGVAKELSSLIFHADASVVTAACKITADAPNCLAGAGSRQAKICERLKLLCVEGTRTQAMHAAATLAKLAAIGERNSEHANDVFVAVVEAAQEDELLDSNLPAVLATVQVVASNAPGLFLRHLEGVERFIVNDVLKRELPRGKKSRAAVSSVAELRGWGIEALANGCCRAASLTREQAASDERRGFIARVVDVLRATLSEPISGTEADAAHVKIAAVKATLLIARTENASIPADVFIAAMYASRYAPDDVIDMIQHGVAKEGLPHVYASALAVLAVECRGDTRKFASDALLAVVDRVRAKSEASVARLSRVMKDEEKLSRTLLTYTPEYALTTLVYLLAHHPSLPSKEDGAANDGIAYRPFQQMISVAVNALVHGTNGETIPAAYAMMRGLKRAKDANEEDANDHGIYVLADIALFVLKDVASTKGWDTGPYPGKVAYDRKLYVVGQSGTARNDPLTEGGRPRVGDFSHLPVGFSLKSGKAAAGGARTKPSGGRNNENALALAMTPAAKPTAAPSRMMPERAARKAAIVDDADASVEDEDDILPESNDADVVNLGRYGMEVIAPPLELPAPGGWDDAQTLVGSDEAATATEAPTTAPKTAPRPAPRSAEKSDAGGSSHKKKFLRPLSDKKNTDNKPSPLTAKTPVAKVASPVTALRRTRRRQENVDEYDFSPELDVAEAPVRVSKKAKGKR
jgi:sister-chromatid-cohesion protein PDS5